MNHLTIILKPTNRCNAHCLYCSAWAPKKKEPVMNENDLEILFHRIEEYITHSRRTKHIKIIWHGGEPLTMPLAFFYKAIELEKKLETDLGISIENNMQSNLLSLTPGKLDMMETLLTFQNKKKTIGTSYDPIEGVRVLRGGDYNKKWEQAIELIKERNFPFGIVYVVHRRSMEQIHQLTDLFMEKFPRTGIRFNPLYKEGRAQDDVCDPLYITPLEWGEFLVNLYGIWESHGKKPSWQPLKEIDTFHNQTDSRMTCDLAGKCGTSHLGIDTDGSAYCCGRGIDRKYKKFGNIRQHSLKEILNHPDRKKMANRTTYLHQTHCNNCQWWKYCHGGCPMDAAINNQNNIFQKTNFCLSRKYYFEKIYKNAFGEPQAGAPSKGI